LIFDFNFLTTDNISCRSKLSREFNVIIERDADGYFVASVPTLKGCHTQAKSLDELMERIREAIAKRMPKAYRSLFGI
ncbi:MAG: type II toxin-antitoxin system HicB family antitoxin, partial [Cyanobacteria bacterium J06635_10]